MRMFRTDMMQGLVWLALGALAPCAAGEAAASWGETMYVGDSITHGVNSGSWRWAMHKILVDNGIDYRAVGCKSGNFQNAGVGLKSSYGGVLFTNIHSSQASARAWELSGRKAGGRFNNTNLPNWLGLSTKNSKGWKYAEATYKPSTFLLLIGTNDLLSDAGPFPAKYDALLGADRAGGDMGVVLDAMYKCNPDAHVVVLTIPCWTRHANSNDSATHQGVADYNTKLREWVEAYNAGHHTNIRLVDVNPGILDVAARIPFYGCEGMFNKPGVDGLHPGAQGDLIMAGHVARALGYAGRSLGLPRKDSSAFHAVPAGNGQPVTEAWPTAPEAGFTAEVELTFGDGAKGGWDAESAALLTIGNGRTSGTLRITESGISWGDAKLYSMDMSANQEPLRVVYTPGNVDMGVPRGYYVWLGDMLIGEALPESKGEVVNGVKISSLTGKGGACAAIKKAGMAPAAYAPATPRFHVPAKAFALDEAAGVAAVKPEGGIPVNPDAQRVSRSAQENSPELAANTGNHQGSLDVTVVSGSCARWVSGHCGGVLGGSATLRLKDHFKGCMTVFGVENAVKVTGDVNIELSAPEAVYTSFTRNKGLEVSAAGAYKGNIDGVFRLQVNKGTLQYPVIGGVHTAPGYVKRSEIFINGGTIGGGVYGGGFTGSTGRTSVTLTGGEVKGGVFGGDASGKASVAEESQVVIKGGTVRGDICGGGVENTVKGHSGVTICGSTAQLHGNTILAGSQKGQTQLEDHDGAILTLSGVRPGAGNHGIDRYTGTLGGGVTVGRRVLVLDDVQADLSAATVRDFDDVRLKGKDTDVHLSSLGGAKRLHMNGKLAVDDVQGLKTVSFGSSGCTLMLDARQLAGGCVFYLVKAKSFNLISTSNVTTKDLENLRFKQFGRTYKAKAVKSDPQAECTDIVLGDPCE